MTRNQASGGDRVRVARSHARRQSAAETRASPLTARSLRTAVAVIEFGAYRCWLPGDLGPGGDPLLERHAVVLAVAALRQRGLPELEGLEVGLRRVRVVLGAGALRERVHDRAGQLSKGACANYHGDAPEAYFKTLKFWKTPLAQCG